MQLSFSGMFIGYVLILSLFHGDLGFCCCFGGQNHHQRKEVISETIMQKYLVGKPVDFGSQDLVNFKPNLNII